MSAKSLLGTALVTLVSLSLLAGTSYAQKTWDGGGDGTSWNDAANWNPNGVPTASDDVVLNTNVSINVADAETVRKLAMSSGTLTGAGSVTVAGDGTAAPDFEWSVGTLDVAFTVSASATSRFFSSSHVIAANRTLTLDGDTDWEGGFIFLANAASLVNNATFTANHESSLSVTTTGSISSLPDFVNNDTFVKEAEDLNANGLVTGTTTFVVDFSNLSSAQVNNGRLDLERGSSTSSDWAVALNAILDFSGTLAHVIDAGDITGDGQVVFSTSSTTTFQNAYNYLINGLTTQSGGGTTIFNNDTSIKQLLVTNGTLQTPTGKTLTISGEGTGAYDLTWNFGTFNADAVLAATATALLQSSSKTVAANRSFTFAGSADWEAGNIFLANGATMTNDSLFWAKHESNLQITTTGSITQLPDFINNATVRKEAVDLNANGLVTGTTTFNVDFSNLSSTEVNNGRIDLERGSTTASDWSVAANAILDFSGNLAHTIDGGDITGDGQVIFSTSAVTSFINAYNYLLNGLTLQSGGGTTTFNNDTSIKRLQTTNGTVQTPAGKTLTITGEGTSAHDLLWGFGTFNADVVVAATATSILQTSSHTLAANRSMTFSGNTDWEGGNIFLANGATMTNDATFWAKHEFSGQITTTGSITQLPDFVNNDIFRKEAVDLNANGLQTGTTTAFVDFSNFSSVEVNNGRLDLERGSTTASDWAVALNAILDFSGNLNHLIDGGDVTGDGQVVFSTSAVTTFQNAYNYLLNGLTTQSGGGTTIFTNDTGIKQLLVTNGTVQTPTGKTLTISGEGTSAYDLTWNLGTFDAEVIVAATATALLQSSSHVVAANRTFTFAGNADWEAGNIFLANGATMTNDATFWAKHEFSGQITTTGSITQLPDFVNNDLFKKEAVDLNANGLQTGTTTVFVDFNNFSSVEVNNGRIDLERGSTTASDWSIAANAILDFSGNLNHTVDGGDVSGDGQVVFSTSALTSFINAYNYLLNGLTLQSGSGTTIFNNDTSIKLLQQTNGTIQTPSGITLTISGEGTSAYDLLWGFGTFDADVVVAAAATALLQSSNHVLASNRAMTFDGDVDWEAGNIFLANGATMVSNAAFNAKHEFNGNIQTTGTITSLPNFTSNGTFVKEAVDLNSNGLQTGTTSFFLDWDNTGGTQVNNGVLSPRSSGENTGTITVAEGAELDINPGFSITYENAAGGLIEGDGLIDVNSLFTNNGAFGPGASAGQLDYQGAYDQTSGTSEFNAEVGGATPGTEHDRLDVEGAADLGGTINASIINSFNPTNGQSFVVLTATGGVTGTYSTENTPGFNVVYTDSTVVLVADIQEVADLGLTKTVSADSVDVGTDVTFTVRLTNNGPNAASSITIDDVLPNGLTFVSASASAGSYNSNNGEWTLGSLANGATDSLTIVATVATAGTKTNTASVGSAGQTDNNSSNNTASADVTGIQVDIAIAKSVDNASAEVGQDVTFTVTATNNGPSDATGIEVTDQLPAGLTYVSDNPSQGSYNDGTGVWNVGDLGNGNSATLELTATVGQTGTLTNTAALTAVDQQDPTTSNNTASASVSSEQSDIAVAKTASADTVNVGDNVTFTVTVTNNGPSDATGVAVTDALPTGLTYVSDNPSQGSYASGSGVWTVGGLANGANATLQLVATMGSASTLTNVASATAVDQPDPDNTNDSDSTDVTGLQVDIAMDKSVDNASPDVGQNVTFTVTATNNGPSDATGIEVTDLLPVGLTYVSDTPSQGTYTAGTGIWNVGDLANGANATLDIVATVDSTGTITNTASVTAVDQSDSDGSNDTASQAISGTVVDIAMTKSVDDANPTVGASVTFTVTATNNGPGDATGVEVTDQLPTGLTYVSHTTSQGTYTSGTGLWDLGSQTNGQADTLVIVASVDQEGTVTNTASVTAVDQPDSDDTNDSASQAVTGGSGGVAIGGIVLDVSFDQSAGKTGEFAGFVETPLAGVLVELFADSEPVGSTTTDTQGAFSFEQAGKTQAQVYELRFLGTRTVPESGESIEVRKVAPDVQMGASTYRLPVALFVQKYSLMYLLTSLQVPPVIGEGEPMQIEPQYDESGAQSLLASWSANVGADREGITNALARLWMAEYALSGLYNDAVWMSNETSYIMFKLLRGFLIAQAIGADIQKNATPQLDRWLQRRVTDECFRGIEFLIRRAFVDEPAKRALAALPPNCSTTIQAAIQSMTTAATESDLVATTDAVSNAIMKQGSERILARYLRDTQEDLDRSVEVAGLFQYTGTADAAYSQVQQIIQGSNQSTTSAHELADFLQAQTNYDQVLQKIISHIGRQPNVGNYVSLSRQIRKAKFGAFGRAVGVLMGRLKDIERADVPAGTGLAFDPGVTKRPIVVVDNNLQQRSAKTVADNLRAAIEPFRQKVSEISTAFAEGRRDDAFNQYDELITLDANLERALLASQAPIIATAEAASDQVAGFDDSFDALTNAISSNQIERAILYGQLLQITDDASITADSIATQADSVFQSLDNAETNVTDLTTAVQGVQARPYVAVTGIALETNLVNLGDTLRVSVTIENQGDSSADGVLVTLAPDASATLLTADSFNVGTMAAAETRTFEWELEIVNGDEAIRSFQIELTSDNALTIPGTGTYNVALIVALEPIAAEIPTEFSLHQSYPNPFNPSTTITFSVPITGHVVIKVYDVLGREITTLVDEIVAAGTFETQFDAGDLPSGAYLYRMESGNFHATKSTILVK